VKEDTGKYKVNVTNGLVVVDDSSALSVNVVVV
jgi:hypothetical protein